MDPQPELKITNTLTRAKEAFRPIDPSHVRMYVCGPTVYDFAHVGNARPVVVFDVLARLLRQRYPKVTYVRNITDVEDKINARAKENGEPIEALTARTAAQYDADMAALGALPPDVAPRATHHIAQMITLIERLIAKGHAYAADGHVLFAVPSMPDYGGLSRRDRDDMIAGARVEVAPYKQDPADFVLWKPSSDDIPGWDSPWGRGRPGWHIECSAMSWEHLGETFDIHGGGLDLIFPHHENEIAQSRCAFGTHTMANYWMHNGFVTVEGEKMSKSLGNFYTVHDVLKEWPGEAIRLLLLSSHYRAPLDFSKSGLKEAKAQLDRLYQALRNAKDVESDGAAATADLMEALLDDLNVPLAIAKLHEAAGRLNKATDPTERSAAKAALLGGGALLGLLQADPEAWFQGGGTDDLDPAEIDRLIQARVDARKGRDFAEADRIRDALKAQGVELEDGPQGTTWKRAG
ncbi:cysteine--tRNA ligase [Thalassobaculum sp.]|uniref:cysteine--tRNA ligase n=1 Tax=Thalassobaculum sp. TaxID=2022740 RepID=UPI0032EF923E